MIDHARRMYADALDRLHDARILKSAVGTRSDASALLDILAFEVLLKCASLLTSGDVRRSHNYLGIWSSLPPAAQEEILSVSRNRMPGHADLSRVSDLLKNYEFIFEKARYQYEFYEGYTSKEVSELGALWVELGSPASEAMVSYRPLELASLIDGLRAFIDRRLQDSTHPNSPAEATS